VLLRRKQLRSKKINDIYPHFWFVSIPNRFGAHKIALYNTDSGAEERVLGHGIKVSIHDVLCDLEGPPGSFSWI